MESAVGVAWVVSAVETAWVKAAGPEAAVADRAQARRCKVGHQGRQIAVGPCNHT